MAQGVVALVFLARITADEPITTDEASKVEWWIPETVTERVDAAYAVRIIDALRPEGLAVRAHDSISVLADFAALP